MTISIIAILETAVAAAIGAALVALFRKLNRFMAEQREANRRNAESIRSMQRAELLRMFQRCVEDGKPITVEELEHVDSCYQAYHSNGGNGTGTWLYERIRENAFVVTKAERQDSNQGGIS